MSYDLIIWDYDGTMANTKTAIHASFCSAARAFGLAEPGRGAVEALIGKSLEFSMAGLFPGLDPELVPRMVEAYREVYPENEKRVVSLYPGIAEAVRSMAGKGALMAVASNKGGPQLAMALTRYGLAECFRVAVGTGRDYPAKPDPAVYERVIAPGVGLDPGERPRILMVGDTDTDLVFGRNIGADLCWCAYGYGNPEACLSHGPELVAQSPDDIPALAGAG